MPFRENGDYYEESDGFDEGWDGGSSVASSIMPVLMWLAAVGFALWIGWEVWIWRVNYIADVVVERAKAVQEQGGD